MASCPGNDVANDASLLPTHMSLTDRLCTWLQCLLSKELHVFRDKFTDWSYQISSGLNSSRSSWEQGCASWEQGCGRVRQTTRCLIIMSSHAACPSSLYPHFCIGALHRPVPVRRWFRLDHASLEPGGSVSLRLKESLCVVVWRWLDKRVSLRVRALPSRSSTEWRKLFLDLSPFLAGSCSYREDAEGRFLVCVSQAGMGLPV